MASRSWCFTLNNYTADDEKVLQSFDVKYLVYGREIGDNETPHLQGFVTWCRAYTLPALKKLVPRAHWEKAKVSDAANYCKKDGDFYEADNRTQGKRTDLESVVDALMQGMHPTQIQTDFPVQYFKFRRHIWDFFTDLQSQRDFLPEVVWIWGDTGSGKTRYVWDKEKSSLWISGRDLRFFDGYHNQDAVLLDDFRGDFCTFHELLRILDRYPLNVNVKGSHRVFNSRRIYITSCYPPDQVYDTREDIKQLTRRIDKVIHLQKSN